jgi:hypothetical protein
VLLWRKSTNGYRRSSYLAYLPRYRNYLHHTSNRLILNEPFLTAAVTWTSFWFLYGVIFILLFNTFYEIFQFMSTRNEYEDRLRMHNRKESIWKTRRPLYRKAERPSHTLKDVVTLKKWPSSTEMLCSLPYTPLAAKHPILNHTSPPLYCLCFQKREGKR